MPNDDYITTAEAAEISGYTIQHIDLLLRLDKVDGHKFGRDWAVSRTSLLEYLKEIEQGGQKRGRKPRQRS